MSLNLDLLGSQFLALQLQPAERKRDEGTCRETHAKTVESRRHARVSWRNRENPERGKTANRENHVLYEWNMLRVRVASEKKKKNKRKKNRRATRKVSIRARALLLLLLLLVLLKNARPVLPVFVKLEARVRIFASCHYVSGAPPRCIGWRAAALVPRPFFFSRDTTRYILTRASASDKNKKKKKRRKENEVRG